MIYLVDSNIHICHSEEYTQISFKEALEILEPLKEVQFDTETLGLDVHTKALLTVQLGNSENQIVFNWQTLSLQDKEAIKEYMESSRLFIGQNLMFDLGVMYKQNIWIKNIYDTMVVEQLIYLGLPRILPLEVVNEIGLEYDAYRYIEGDEKKKAHYELKYDLNSIARRYLGIDIDKSVRGKIAREGLTDEVIIYAGTDVKYLEAIKEKQLEELERQNLLKAAEFECAFVKFLAYVKFCGIHLDVTKWKDKMKNDQARLDAALNILNNYVIDLDNEGFIYRWPETRKERLKVQELGFTRCPEKDNDNECYQISIKGKFAHMNLQHSLFEEFDDYGYKCDINWSSSKQVIALFELLGVNVMTFDKKTKKEKKSIEEKQLIGQVDKFPILNTFLDYQHAAKVVSTYGQNWLDAINPKTGRIHVELHSLGTNTARVSSGGGPYKLNQQNLPHDSITRGCFTAEEGNMFLSCDFSGQESCLTASVSKDKKMSDILNNNGDLHSEVARSCWPEILGKLSDKEVKELYKDLRQSAKNVEFAIFYGGNDDTLVKNKGFSKEQANSIYNNFMNSFPGIKKYQDWCRQNVATHGMIVMNSVLKHRAHIYDAKWQASIREKMQEPGFWDYYRDLKKTAPKSDTVQSIKRYFKRKSDCEREAINFRIQNRGACAFKYAAILLFNWIVNNNYQNIVQVVAIVHDK
jgi:DNA polymerase I-like protein with 3'-5' exonuclease and polymerase domains